MIKIWKASQLLGTAFFQNSESPDSFKQFLFSFYTKIIHFVNTLNYSDSAYQVIIILITTIVWTGGICIPWISAIFFSVEFSINRFFRGFFYK